MRSIITPDEVINDLENSILNSVQSRIESGPDVSDTYLHIDILEDGFDVKVLYIEETDLSNPNHDVPLLDLMVDLNDLEGEEIWIPNESAIRKVAESYRELIEIDICEN